MDGFGIDRLQAEYIAEIKLRNLNKEYILNRTDEICNLEKDIEKLKNTVKDDNKIKKVIIDELSQIIKKYGKERRTEIIHEKYVEEVKEEHMIEDYNLKLFMTRQNYLKKISLVSLRGSSEHKIKGDDEIVQEIETSNKADLLLFTNKKTVYKIKIQEINDCKASSLGEYLPNILGMDENEDIIYIVATIDYNGFMLFSFENGKIAKINLSSYATKTNRRKLANAYSDKVPLINIDYLEKDIEKVAFSNIY